VADLVHRLTGRPRLGELDRFRKDVPWDEYKALVEPLFLALLPDN
jgi:hypothetical protein